MKIGELWSARGSAAAFAQRGRIEMLQAHRFCRAWKSGSIAAALQITLLLVAFPLHGQVQPGSEEGELAELLSIVEQETAVATKTRMNSDFVPGIVTVLEGDELEALGIATAGEALGLVPGMQSALDSTSGRTVIVRGLDFPFNSGNIRILLNSVPLARSDGGINTAVLLIPVEQVERIEVIRGPGSVIHGDFAFMGLVNIITRKEGTRAFGRLSTPQRSVSAGVRAARKAGATSLAASLSRFVTNDAVATGPNRDDDRWLGVFTAGRGGFSLAAQTVQRTYNENALGRPGEGIPFEEDTWAVEGRYQRAFHPKLRAEALVSILKNDIYNFSFAFDGDQTKIAANVMWDGWARQSWLVAADRSHSTIDHGARRRPPPPGQTIGPLQTLVTGADRDITGFILQDTIDLANAVALTLGARYDSYSDLDSRVTPRAALVWRASDRHIVKAQYAEGFRPPTFFELYETPARGSSPRYPFETNATAELHYVYRGPLSVARATVYRTVLSDMIRPGGVVMADDARATGVELEWGRQLTPSWKIDANVSFVDTSDPRTGSPTPRENQVSAPVLGNVSLFYRPIPGLVLTSRWNHVGDPAGGEGFDLLDLTVSREELFISGLSARAGVRNALDSDVTALQQRPTGDVAVSAFPGRSAWIQLSWRR